MNTFGRLQRIDLRKGWSSEAGDFTPWLGNPDNIALLGETIGIELEPLRTEHPVGPYRADLVCTDTETESLVLIENQLEKTNHTHLGQLLTYAAGLQAVTIVWIARDFTDEHRAALDWLNDHTPDTIRIFGLEIELWQIGDSPPAPKFNIVAEPNDWVKSGTTAGMIGLSSTRQCQLEFWTGFQEWIESHGNGIIPPRRPGPRQWMATSPFGCSGCHGNAAVNTNSNVIRVELYLRGPHATQRFDHLHDRKDAVEEAFGQPLIWQPLPNKKGSRIKLELNDADISDQDDLARQYDWMGSHLERLITVMRPFVMAAAAAGEAE